MKEVDEVLQEEKKIKKQKTQPFYFSNESDPNVNDASETTKMQEILIGTLSSSDRSASESSASNFDPHSQPTPFETPPLRHIMLRSRPGHLNENCNQCGCTGSCKMLKTFVNSSCQTPPLYKPSEELNPFPQRPLRIKSQKTKSTKRGQIPRLVDPEVLETLVANIAIEKVSVSQAIRSFVRYGNGLFGQNYVLPKSLRRHINQSIMDKRRRKKKSKFQTGTCFQVHPTSSENGTIDENDEWEEMDVVDEGLVSEIHFEDISFGILDDQTGEILRLEEDDFDQSDFEEDPLDNEEIEISEKKVEETSKKVTEIALEHYIVESKQMKENGGDIEDYLSNSDNHIGSLKEEPTLDNTPTLEVMPLNKSEQLSECVNKSENNDNDKLLLATPTNSKANNVEWDIDSSEKRQRLEEEDFIDVDKPSCDNDAKKDRRCVKCEFCHRNILNYLYKLHLELQHSDESTMVNGGNLESGKNFNAKYLVNVPIFMFYIRIYTDSY